MLKVDEFESAFRAADKKVFHLAPPVVKRVLIVTDIGTPGLDSSTFDAGPRAFLDASKALLSALGESVEYVVLNGDGYRDMETLLNAVMEAGPDLIVSYRNLRDGLWRWGYNLGSVLSVLITETPEPVLIVPNPYEFPDLPFKDSGTDSVMVVTDHLAGDDALTNWGVALTRAGGKLWLAHVEDDSVFERYMDVISKLPSIDTEGARRDIRGRLLREPHDYIARIREVIEAEKVPIDIGEIVTTGHRVRDYTTITGQHGVDLLCFHTDDDEQIAMHGAAYALAVELRRLPMLLL
jgi:nucleotide-binding universal stress UspA family protein